MFLSLLQFSVFAFFDLLGSIVFMVIVAIKLWDGKCEQQARRVNARRPRHFRRFGFFGLWDRMPVASAEIDPPPRKRKYFSAWICSEIAFRSLERRKIYYDFSIFVNGNWKFKQAVENMSYTLDQLQSNPRVWGRGIPIGRALHRERSSQTGAEPLL